MDENFDVVIVGGGAAGLSAAVTLGRSRRSVLVVDAGNPRNAPADGVHNLLGREGVTPAHLLASGRAEAGAYGARVVPGVVTSVERDTDGFRVFFDERVVTARRVLIATGLVDELPDVPGVAQRWGRDVLHCPYCHGWEVRDRAIGVLATTPMAVHQAQLFRQLSADVIVFEHVTTLGDADRTTLAALGIEVVTGEVVGLEVANDRLTGVRTTSGTVPRDTLVVAPRFTSRADFLAPLGLVPEPLVMGGTVLGTAIPADANGATSVPGVWIAGNATDLRAQVVTASAEGVAAGAAINADLIAEDTARAILSHAG